MPGSKLEGLQGALEDVAQLASRALLDRSAATSCRERARAADLHCAYLFLADSVLKDVCFEAADAFVFRNICLQHPTHRVCEGLPSLRGLTWILGQSSSCPLLAREERDRPQSTTAPGLFLEEGGTAHSFPPPPPPSFPGGVAASASHAGLADPAAAGAAAAGFCSFAFL